MAEHNQQFDTFVEWVNKASSWLTRRGPYASAVCIDAKGRICQMGAHFMRARDEDTFPVRWVWPDDEGYTLAIVPNAHAQGAA